MVVVMIVFDEICFREPTGFSGLPQVESYIRPYSLYKFVVASSVQLLRWVNFNWTANVLGALLWEPAESIKAAKDLNYGKSLDFHDFGMNPKKLSEKQLSQTPILALHGKNGTQGTFLGAGEFFQKNGIGPLFTVNLSDGELTEKDREIIDEKILEIKRLYGRDDIQIDLIGYSRGAEMALYAALPKDSYRIHEGYCCQTKKWEEFRPEVRRIIRIGSMTTFKEWSHLSLTMQKAIWEIRGMDDIHMPETSYCVNKVEVEGVGHLGLPSHIFVLRALKSLLS